VSVGVLDSAVDLPKEDPGRAAAIAVLEAAVWKALASPAPGAAADDRSDAYRSLVGARTSAGDEVGARRVAAEWARFLEAEAAKAKDPEASAVFDSHRLSAYLVLGEPGKAVAMLEKSERELPHDYNPPNRLARAYAAEGEWTKALAALARAASLATGRARLRVLATRAELLLQKGDPAAARKSYDEAIAYAESLPPGERPARQIERLRKAREKVPTPRSTP
jgi:predicted Zn-dependent protease